MNYHPITPEQEQELRERARWIWQGEGVKRVAPDQATGFVAGLLASWVFKGGRLANTVSPQDRLRIAGEERPGV
ncbi:MAG: hypothetical protein J2P36_25780 [Ktedonobacteraceae bacterium]|nr:hypothetical protein [Ktedonobacteraceae bacterium]